MLGHKFLASLLLSLSLAYAGEAQFTWVQGRVEVLDADGKARRGEKGKPIAEGETVRSGTDGGAIVELEDGSRMKLREGSSLKLTRYKLQEGARKTSLELLGGAVFSKVAKLGVDDRFTLQVATAIAGVRGTEFFASFGRKVGGAAAADVWLCVNEGAVEVKAEGDKGVAVKAGEGIVVPEGKTVTPPRPYAWTKGLNWNMDPAKGEVRDRTRLDKLYRDPREVHYD